ncbi:MAG: hypothetical protein ACOY0T_28905 [Myxococcota bacterium]
MVYGPSVKTGKQVPATDKDGNIKRDKNNKPIMVDEREEGSRRIIRDEDGKVVGEEPYDKASTSELRKDADAEGSTEHHAEQRMVRGAEGRDEEVTAMAASKECCPGCHQALKDSGNLDKIPADMQGKPPGMG